MNRILFLFPIEPGSDDVYGYVGYNDRIRSLQCPTIRHTVYVFVLPGYERLFEDYINALMDGRDSSGGSFGRLRQELEFRKFVDRGGKQLVMSSSPPGTNICKILPTIGLCAFTTVYTISIKTQARMTTEHGARVAVGGGSDNRIVTSHLLDCYLCDLKLKMPFFYHLAPDSAETLFKLSIIFASTTPRLGMLALSSSSTQSDNMMQDMTGAADEATTIFKLVARVHASRPNDGSAIFENMFAPTGIFNCTIHDNGLLNFMYDRNDQKSTRSLLDTIPVVYITTWSRPARVHPNSSRITQTIMLIYICIYHLDDGGRAQMQSILFINTLGGGLMYGPGWWPIRDESPSSDAPNVRRSSTFYMRSFLNEHDLLAEFHSIYMRGRMFTGFKYDGLHFLRIDRMDMQNILDAMALYKNIPIEDSVSICDDVILLSTRGVYVETGCAPHNRGKQNQRSPYKQLPVGTETGDFLDYFTFHMNSKVSGDIETPMVCIDVSQRSSLQPMAAQVYEHIPSATKRNFPVITPISIIDDIITFAKKTVRRRQAVDEILVLSRELNTSIITIGCMSMLKRSERFIFNYFLNRGAILFSTPFLYPNMTFAETSTSLVPQHTTMAAATSSTTAAATNASLVSTLTRSWLAYPVGVENRGGFNYTRPGVYASGGFEIDFSSFYPSIVRKFRLSFNTTMIVSGTELLGIIGSNDEFRRFLAYDCALVFDYETYARLRFTSTADATEDVNMCVDIGDDEDPENLWSTMGNDVVTVTCTDHGSSSSSSLVPNRNYVVILDVDVLQKHANLHLPSLYSMFEHYNKLGRKSTRDGGSGKALYKSLMNTLIGCLGSKTFEYYSPQLYNVITFMGRRVIRYAACIANSICANTPTLPPPFDDFVTQHEWMADRLNLDHVVQINTDGFICRASCPKRAAAIITSINSSLATSFRRIDNNNGGGGVGDDIREILKCRLVRHIKCIFICNGSERYVWSADDTTAGVVQIGGCATTEERTTQQRREDDAFVEHLKRSVDEAKSVIEFERNGANNKRFWKLILIYLAHFAQSPTSATLPSSNSRLIIRELSMLGERELHQWLTGGKVSREMTEVVDKLKKLLGIDK